MANIRKWLENAEAECGETIEAAVVGKHDNASWGEPAAPNENVVLPRDEALHLLDAEFDSGHGGADCRPVYAWTATRIYFIHEYDGATGLVWVPRNPQPVEPGFSGMYD